jgi:hypothetical protein
VKVNLAGPGGVTALKLCVTPESPEFSSAPSKVPTDMPTDSSTSFSPADEGTFEPSPAPTDGAPFSVDETKEPAIPDATPAPSSSAVEATPSPSAAPLLGAIAGMVRDDEGTPLAGAIIELLDSNDSVVDTVTTTSDGTYLFEDLEAGQYTVLETNPGSHPLDVDDFDLDEDGDATDGGLLTTALM